MLGEVLAKGKPFEKSQSGEEEKAIGKFWGRNILNRRNGRFTGLETEKEATQLSAGCSGVEEWKSERRGDPF